MKYFSVKVVQTSVLICLVVYLFPSISQAQSEAPDRYQIFFTSISDSIKSEGVWPFKTEYVQYTPQWNVNELITSASGDTFHQIVDSSRIDGQRYKIWFGQNELILAGSTNVNTWQSKWVKKGEKYLFYVKGEIELRSNPQNQTIQVDSDEASIVTGSNENNSNGGNGTNEVYLPPWKGFLWLIMPPFFDRPNIGPLPLWWDKIEQDAVMAEGSSEFFFLFKKSSDNAGVGGVISFTIIRTCIWGSFLVFLFGALMHLRLSKIFPFIPFHFITNLINFIKRLFRFRLSYNFIYKERKLPDYQKILDTWDKIHLDTTLIKADAVWTKISPKDRALYVKQSDLKTSTMKVEDFEQMQIKLWSTMGFERVGELIQTLENFKHGKKRNKKNYQILNIIKAGLENMKINGYRWQEASVEVDRAMENAASSELEKLKNTSVIEWFWNLGTIAPLAGLFGTVWGISFAFKRLSDKAEELGANLSAADVIRELGPSINEALWTTIFGLMVGMALMFVYFYYKNKLGWIYSKWEEIFVQLTEKI